MLGNIANLNKKGEINSATATFGQGISVTTLQMITAFSAIINGGKLMRPYVVSQVISGDEVIRNTQPQVVRQVISPNNSAILRGMLVSVVENGHAKKAQIDGYRVGGKTGTAQVPDSRGGYKSDDHIIGSFVGFAPFETPRIAILVRVDEPIEGRLGETVAAPVFTEVAKFALQYYNVPHDK
jgi:cell division protein FtsI/penicillin-binding protein 2